MIPVIRYDRRHVGEQKKLVASGRWTKLMDNSWIPEVVYEGERTKMMIDGSGPRYIRPRPALRSKYTGKVASTSSSRITHCSTTTTITITTAKRMNR